MFYRDYRQGRGEVKRLLIYCHLKSNTNTNTSGGFYLEVHSGVQGADVHIASYFSWSKLVIHLPYVRTSPEKAIPRIQGLDTVCIYFLNTFFHILLFSPMIPVMLPYFNDFESKFTNVLRHHLDLLVQLRHGLSFFWMFRFGLKTMRAAMPMATMELVHRFGGFVVSIHVIFASDLVLSAIASVAALQRRFSIWRRTSSHPNIPYPIILSSHISHPNSRIVLFHAKKDWNSHIVAKRLKIH